MGSPPKSAGATPVAREAWRHVLALMFSDQNQGRVHAACESVGLTMGLMKALLSIEPGGAKPMKLLAGQWRCDASYVTSLVDGLEQRGIVARRGHPTDRRAKTVTVTPKGERVRTELLELLHQPPDCLGVLSVAEQRKLRDLLGKVVDALEPADEGAAAGTAG